MEISLNSSRETFRGPSTIQDLIKSLGITTEMWNSEEFNKILKMSEADFDKLKISYIKLNPVRLTAWKFRNMSIGLRIAKENLKKTSYELKLEECTRRNNEVGNNPNFCDMCKHRGYICFVSGKPEDKEVFVVARYCSCNQH